MRILIINGSPKGENSATLYTSLYIQKHRPEHQFSVLQVGKLIRQFETDFSEAEKAINESDLILFSYPVYTFIIPCQLHRFIELIKEKKLNLEDKWVSQITTSKHFYDVTAHRFIEDNCRELQMKFVKGLSADMDDLTTKKGRKEALAFFDYLIHCVENDIHEPYGPKQAKPKHVAVTVAEPVEKSKKGSIALVADLADEDIQLKSMIDSFTAQCAYEVDLINIHKFQFQGGCISCFRCSATGKCFYRDGFQELLRERIQKASAIVLAFSIKDHSMGSIFKTYDDRQFCNGHRTVTMGMPFAYLISGDYSKEDNLQTIVNARAEVGGNFLAGVATDEFNPDKEIHTMTKRLEYAIEQKYVQPANFYGVGGMKVFRDLIWLMQGLMKEDHRFYKQHNQYDFPQKKWPTMLVMYLVGIMFTNEKTMAKIGPHITEGMIGPYKKALEE